MAVAVAQTPATTGSQKTGSSITALSLTGVASTSVLIVTVATNGTSTSYVTGITDNASTHYTWSRIIGSNAAVAGVGIVDVWQGVGGSGGSVALTVTLGHSAGYDAQLYELSGANVSTPVDTASGAAPATATGTSNAPATASLTPSQAGELILGWGGFNNVRNATPSSPWVDVNQDYAASTSRAGVTSGVGYSAVWGFPGSYIWLTTAIIFQPPAVASGTPAPPWMTQPMVPILPSVPVGA